MTIEGRVGTLQEPFSQDGDGTNYVTVSVQI